MFFEKRIFPTAVAYIKAINRKLIMHTQTIHTTNISSADDICWTQVMEWCCIDRDDGMIRLEKSRLSGYFVLCNDEEVINMKQGHIATPLPDYSLHHDQQNIEWITLPWGSQSGGMFVSLPNVIMTWWYASTLTWHKLGIYFMLL